MRRHELAIEQRESANAEARDKMGKRNFRSIGGATDHRFAEEGATQRDPVKPADKFAV